MPDGLLTKFAKFKAKSEDRTLAMLGSVLVHEQFHVFQRHYPELMAKLYGELWGFKHVEKIESCDWLQARHLANPDGLDCRWVFPITENGTTRYIWPLVIFAETDTPQQMGPDFRMVALDLTETGKDAYKVQVNDDKIPKYADLLSVEAYKGKFSFWGEIFHPHEISAEFFSSIVLVDKLAPKGMIKPEKAEAMEKQIGPARVWLHEHCK